MSQTVPADFLDQAKKVLGNAPRFISSSPGRVDLLNTHQDYKRLPVVPMAIDMRLYMFAVPTPEFTLRVVSEELSKEPGGGSFELDLSEPSNAQRDTRGYLASVIRTVRKFSQARDIGGLSIYVRSQIPMGSGLGSSGALEVAFLSLLDGAFSLGFTKRDIAEYAYLSENVEMGIPCGRLDQYSSAYGDMIVLRQRPTISVDYLNAPPLDFVVIDSGEKHRTESIHTARQSEIDHGLSVLSESTAVHKGLKSKLGRSCQETDWESIRRDEISRYLFLLPRKSADRMLFTLQMNSSTSLALSAVSRQKVDIPLAISVLGQERATRLAEKDWPVRETLGEVMNVQHELLRDLYEVSTPRLERIRDAALYFGGAIGVKISGAGMGGSLVALVRDKAKVTSVVKEATEAGAANAWHVQRATGCWFRGA